ncbi:hypothetical protein B484DRAFT_459445 [Ochromonadaceae sp. CCMP2298]|nr:hypothetical protein B484DRAFT_459445 [Ochromonadaceae sp. CCMP2298]
MNATLQLSNCHAGRVSKSAFTGASAKDHAEIDVDDPDFWKKLLPDLVTPDILLQVHYIKDVFFVYLVFFDFLIPPHLPGAKSGLFTFYTLTGFSSKTAYFIII